MLDKRHLELLSAYVDGELGSRQRKLVMRLLRNSPEARTAVRHMQQHAKASPSAAPSAQAGLLAPRRANHCQPGHPPHVAGAVRCCTYFPDRTEDSGCCRRRAGRCRDWVVPLFHEPDLQFESLTGHRQEHLAGTGHRQQYLARAEIHRGLSTRNSHPSSGHQGFPKGSRRGAQSS